MIKWTKIFFSKIGLREQNQDFLSFFSIKKNKRLIDVLIICDGVGGRPNGKDCSNVVGKEVERKIRGYLNRRKSKTCLNEHDMNSIKKILSDLPKLSADPLSMTTLSLVINDRKKNKEGFASISLWVGDSRIYAIDSKNSIFQISNDQVNNNGHLSVMFSGKGKLIGEMGVKFISFCNPLLICVTSDGMNCQLRSLYKYLVACLYFQVNSNKIFEEKTTQFLGNLIYDNYSAALLYKHHSMNVIRKAYQRNI